MYKVSELFETPSDNSKIWRYLDFSKFIDMLNRQKLYFPRLDKLDDPFEGVCPLPSLDSIMKKLEIPFSEEKTRGFQKHYSKYIKQTTAVNCWHLNSFESAVMWKMYVKSGEGIAIQSTVRRLKDSISNSEDDIFIGSVKYINFKNLTQTVDPYKVVGLPIIYKRKIYQPERELRAIIRREPKGRTGIVYKPRIDDGIYVPVNLDILINEIYLAPTTQKWQHTLLETMMNKYELNKRIIQSGLDDKP
jgi:hypothetical protein